MHFDVDDVADDQIVDLLRHWRRLEAERHTSALSHRLAGEDSWQLSGATWFDTPTNDSGELDVTASVDT